MNSIFYGATDMGRCRENNEDAYILEQNGDYVLDIVVDGIGGYDGGEVASFMACKCISEYLKATSTENLGLEVLQQAVIYANNSILSLHSNPFLSNMGCVLTAVLFDIKQNFAYMCHVGDTRLYQYKDGELKKMSIDHSIVGEQLDSGAINEEDAMCHPRRNIITKSVGSRYMEWGTDYMLSKIFPIQSGTQYLMCSDGLYDMLSSTIIANVLAKKTTLCKKVETLIQFANEAGGKDNITVTLLEIIE